MLKVHWTVFCENVLVIENSKMTNNKKHWPKFQCPHIFCVTEILHNKQKIKKNPDSKGPMDNAVQKHIKCEFCGMEFPQQGWLKAHMTFSICKVTRKKVSLTFCDMIPNIIDLKAGTNHKCETCGTYVHSNYYSLDI